MKWQIDYGERSWHRWFAWYPVQLSFKHRDTRVWLEWIEREIINVQGYMIHHYRPLTAGLEQQGGGRVQ
jgi:hypothetical protein